MKIVSKTLITSDNFKIDATIHIPIKKSKKIIIMCHGLSSFKDGRKLELLKLAEKLCECGFKVIRFDFRGHGKSSGRDIDVTVESFITDLDCVIKNEISQNIQISLFGFSFGGFTIMEYINRYKINVDKIVLWSPPLNPWGSSFNNSKTFCFQEINEAINSGTIEKDGYVLLKEKGFRLSNQLIKQCQNYNYEEAIKALPKNDTLILQAIDDKNIDKEYNEKYAQQFQFHYKEFKASHSLFEKLDEAIDETIKFFIN